MTDPNSSHYVSDAVSFYCLKRRGDKKWSMINLLSALIVRQGMQVATRGFFTQNESGSLSFWVTPSYQLWETEENLSGLEGAQVVVELAPTAAEAAIADQQVAVEGIWRDGRIAEAEFVPLPSVVPGWVLSAESKRSVSELKGAAYTDFSHVGWECAKGNGISVGGGREESEQFYTHFQVRLVTPEFAQWHEECPWSVDVFVSILPQKYRQLNDWPGSGPAVADWASLRSI